MYTVLDRPSSQIPSIEINIRKIYNHKLINLKFELKFQVQLNLSNKTFKKSDKKFTENINIMLSFLVPNDEIKSRKGWIG